MSIILQSVQAAVLSTLIAGPAFASGIDCCPGFATVANQSASIGFAAAALGAIGLVLAFSRSPAPRIAGLLGVGIAIGFAATKAMAGVGCVCVG